MQEITQDKKFKLRKMTVYELCIMAMLVAITFALSSVSGFLRIGTIGKIDIKFVSVFIGGAMFGPIAGALIGAAADVVSWAVNPIGSLLISLTVIEAINGALFGFLLFYKKDQSDKIYIVKIVICALLQFALNLICRTVVLMRIGALPQSFFSAILLRLPGCSFNLAIKIVALILLQRFLPRLSQILKK